MSTLFFIFLLFFVKGRFLLKAAGFRPRKNMSESFNYADIFLQAEDLPV